MLDFENTLLEGFSVSGKIGGKVSSKAKASGKIGGSVTGNAGFSGVVKRVQAGVKAATRGATPAPAPRPAPVRVAVSASTPRISTPMRAVLRGDVKTLPHVPSVAGKIGVASAAIAAVKKPEIPMAIKEKVASQIALKAIDTLKHKAPKVEHKHDTHKKAEKVLEPIAHACGCGGTKNIRIIIHREMAKSGMPPHSADGLLAMLHDMNAMLEKAANQRLATFEHKSIVAKRDFEHEVLARLSALSKCLPECHPVRTRAQLTIFRKAR